jgi:hypothetical protein
VVVELQLQLRSWSKKEESHPAALLVVKIFAASQKHP